MEYSQAPVLCIQWCPTCTVPCSAAAAVVDRSIGPCPLEAALRHSIVDHIPSRYQKYSSATRVPPTHRPISLLAYCLTVEPLCAFGELLCQVWGASRVNRASPRGPDDRRRSSNCLRTFLKRLKVNFRTKGCMQPCFQRILPTVLGQIKVYELEK